jgi:hypothetical protein
MSRIANRTIAYSEIGKWFRGALRQGDPTPSNEALDRLAREFQVLLNRANNAELRRIGKLTPRDEKDASLAEWHSERIQKLGSAAKALIDAANEYERDIGNVFQAPDRDWSMDELREMLLGIAVFAGPVEPAAPVRGRRAVPWHDAASKFAKLVAQAMRDVGYSGSLRITDPGSVTSVVTAAAISWAYGKKLSPEGLVTNMRKRRRGKSAGQELWPFPKSPKSRQ